MPSLHPLLVLTSPPEALSQGPTGLSIRNVAVALKERFLIFTACTNQRCCRPCICLWRGCSFRCTSEYEKKNYGHPMIDWDGCTGRGRLAVFTIYTREVRAVLDRVCKKGEGK